MRLVTPVCIVIDNDKIAEYIVIITTFDIKFCYVDRVGAVTAVGVAETIGQWVKKTEYQDGRTGRRRYYEFVLSRC